MLELYFKYPRVLRRLRSGALGGAMDRIAAHFSEVGYKRASAKDHISQLGRFSDFAARNARTAVIDQTVIDRFMHSLRTACAPHRRTNGNRARTSGRARAVFHPVSHDAGSPRPTAYRLSGSPARSAGLGAQDLRGAAFGRTPDPRLVS